MADSVPPASARPLRFQFGGVTLDRRTGRVYRGREALALEPRAYDLLVYFIEHGGEVLSRDALMDAVWKGVHVAPHSLTQAVLQLRQALGDDRDTPRFIETVHRRGYRFVAAIRALGAADKAAKPTSRFPARTMALIGREALLDELIVRLPTTRLLTLSGPGGVGKTQLALELARRIEHDFRDAVLVDLSIVDADEAVEREIAVALGAADDGARGFAVRVAQTVGPRRVLLLLDNCEHVVEACRPLIQQLLEACPSLTIVATTQVPVGVRGEALVRVPALRVPEVNASTQRVAALETNPAVTLFVREARSVEPSFVLTAENAGAVADICRRLEGLPLALELAASRVNVLTPQEIVGRLDAPWRVLARRRTTGPPRHETLAATLEWSVALLTPREQDLLTQCGVFNGGWTLDAVAAIAAEHTRPPSSTLEAVQSLVEKSLVVADTTGPHARYRLLETVRLYARNRLSEAADRDGVSERHLDFYTRVVVDAQPRMLTGEQDYAADAIEAETGNIRDALAWGLGRTEPVKRAVQMALAMMPYWLFRGLFSEGAEWLARAVARGEHWSDELLAQTRCALGVFQHMSTRFLDSRRTFLSALPSLAPDDRATRAFTLGFLGFNYAVTGETARAEQTLAEARALADALNADYLIAVALIGQGVAAGARGCLPDAAASLEDARRRLDRLGERFMLSYAAVNLGLQLYLAGRVREAEAAFIESLRASQQIRNRRAIAGCFEGLGYIAAAAADARWAARLMGAADALRAVTAPLFPQWKDAHERVVGALDQALGADLARREWIAGGRIDVDDLVADILAQQG